MHLQHLGLRYFRNYARLEVDLPARIVVLQGENAQGKTNLLEAIYYLATTKSPLATQDRQLISWSAAAEAIPYARLEGAFCAGGEEHAIDITLMVERPDPNAGQAAFRRQIRLNGIPRRALDIVGKLNVVLFLPQDTELVAGSAGARRHYLDVTLCQIDATYCRNLARYNRVITQRNALLHQIREHHSRPMELEYWDDQLAQLGAQVQSRRYWAVAELGRYCEQIQPALTGGQERLALRYHNSVTNALSGAQRERPAEDAVMEAELLGVQFRRGLGAVRQEEIARGVSLVGPHRDDVGLRVNDVDMTVYGSRGQQRTVALALKLAEVELMEHATGETPLLLLDDMLSELDPRRAQYLLQTLSAAQQVLITTTDLYHCSGAFLQSAALWRVVNGTISVEAT